MMPKSKKQSKEKDTKASANSVTDSSPNKPEDCKVEAKQQQLLETKKTKWATLFQFVLRIQY